MKFQGGKGNEKAKAQAKAQVRTCKNVEHGNMGRGTQSIERVAFLEPRNTYYTFAQACLAASVYKARNWF